MKINSANIAIALTVVAVGALATSKIVSLTQTKPPAEMGKLPPYELIHHTGKTFASGKDLAGKISVTNFIFTSCPQTCPILTKAMKKFQDRYASENLNFISISVDPKTDTPDVLKTFGEKFKADLSRWHFLTGTLEDIKNTLIKGYKIGFMGEKVTHSDRFVLVDDKQTIRGYYSASSPTDMERLEKDIASLLKKI